MLVTLLGIVTDARLLQPRNKPSPRLVTLLGMEIEVMPHILKASSPIVVTLSPKDIRVKLEQREKA